MSKRTRWALKSAKIVPARVSLAALQHQILHVQLTSPESKPSRGAFQPDATVTASVRRDTGVIGERVRIDKISADLRHDVRRRCEPCRLDDLPHIANHQGRSRVGSTVLSNSYVKSLLSIL
jgi:hypothetical protein